MVMQLSKERANDADGDDREDRDDKEIRRQRKHLAGLADPSQVPVEEEQHHADGDRDLVVPQHRKGGRHRVRPCGRLHRHRHDVVDDQGNRGDLGDSWPEVLTRDDVGTSGLGVGHHDLSVRERDKEQHRDDRKRDRQE